MATNVYVLDLDRGSDARVWNEILGTHRACNWVPSITVNGSDRVSPEPPKGSVLICHQWSDAALRAVTRLASGGVHVVLVSLATGDGREVASGVYRRRRPVAKQPSDRHFKACFEAFLRDLDVNGTPNWKLLEGRPPPDALLTFHLLGLLPNDAEAIMQRQMLSANAIAEAKAIAEIPDGPGIPPLVALDDPQQLREFLRACS